MDQIPHSASLRLLVIRLSAMGDVAMVAPVLAALRKNYPNIQITMLTPKFLQPFFREVGEMSFFSPDLKNVRQPTRLDPQAWKCENPPIITNTRL